MGLENPLLKLSFQTRGWITLSSSFFLHFILGVFYLWGSISTYTTSYLQQTGSNVNKDDAGLVFPFTFFAIDIGTPFGVGLATYFGWQKYIFVASFLCGLSVLISSFVLRTFMLFVLFYGIIFGLLVGVLYMVPFNTCYMYFPHRKGLVSGVITGGFAFGSAVFIWLIFGIVNPNNEKAATAINGGKYFSNTVVNRYPESLRVLGIVMMAIGCLSSFFHLRPNPEEVQEFEEKLKQKAADKSKNVELQQIKDEENGNLQNGQAENDQKILPLNGQNPPATNQKSIKQKEVFYEFQTMRSGLATKFIYISTFLAFCYTAYGTMVVSQYKNYGEYNGYQDSFLSAVGTVGSVMNGVARIFWGFLMEKFTIMQLLVCNLCMQIALSFIFSWVASVQGLFFIWIILGYFLYGAWLAILPALINRIYGKKIGTQIYSLTFFGFVLASFLQFFLIKYSKDKIGWQHTFWIFTLIQLVGLLTALFVRFNAVPPSEKDNKPKEILGTEQQPITNQN